MDPKDIQMKTGFSMDESDDDAKGRFIATTMGLMQVFSEEALKTAAQYVIGSGRTDVTDEDVLKALKFQARMFFQRVEDLEGRVDEATQEILELLNSDEEESDEEYESDSDDADIHLSANTPDKSPGRYVPTPKQLTMKQKKTVGSLLEINSHERAAMLQSFAQRGVGQSQVDSMDENEKNECIRIVSQVDSIVKSWEKYNPDDPILQFIKSAIDKTEVSKDED